MEKGILEALEVWNLGGELQTDRMSKIKQAENVVKANI